MTALLGAAVTINALHDEGAAEPPPTTADPYLLSAGLTTPPTLALAEIDEPVARTTEPTIGADLLVVPEFEAVADVDEARLAAYDINQAVASNAPGSEPMRAMFRISGLALVGSDLAARPASVSIIAASDPRAGRDSLTITVGDTLSRTVVDRVGRAVYRSSPALPDDVWAKFPESDALAGTDASDLGELFDAIVTGPLTVDLLALAQVAPADGLVRLGGGTLARRYDVVVGVDDVRPRGALMFAAAARSTLSSRPGTGKLAFEVYVTDEPALALLTSQFEVDGQPRLFTQVFDGSPANVTIELPAPDAVVGGR